MHAHSDLAVTNNIHSIAGVEFVVNKNPPKHQAGHALIIACTLAVSDVHGDLEPKTHVGCSRFSPHNVSPFG